MAARGLTDAHLLRLRNVAVLAVTGIAAVISYLHIEGLALAHGQSPLAAHLLPLSVDGAVAAASLDMAVAARGRGGRMSWIARSVLVAGVAATVAANVTYGWPHGWLAGVMSGWPALAFIGCAEMAIQSTRRRARAAVPAAPAAAERAPAGRHGGRRGAAVPATGRELAAIVGVSERTGRRRLAQLRGQVPEPTP